MPERASEPEADKETGAKKKKFNFNCCWEIKGFLHVCLCPEAYSERQTIYEKV